MTGYHAQVQSDGLVTAVHKVSAERLASHRHLYPGVWVPVPDMAQFPAIGWTWSANTGFVPPPPDLDGEVEE
jgi:hypothetical protein